MVKILEIKGILDSKGGNKFKIKDSNPYYEWYKSNPKYINGKEEDI